MQTQTAQNTAQGDAATPLETGARQRADAEKRQAAEAKAAREAAPAELNRERQQKRLKDAQELTKCLSSGMDLLTPGQVRQITDAATEAGNEPMDALRSFGERLRILREENPHASEADLREAVEGAVRVIVTRAREEREQRKRPGTQQVAAAFKVPREALPLPEVRRAARQNIPGPPSGRTLRGAESEVEQMHNYISRIGTNLHEAIGNRDADLIRSYRRALNSGIARAHEVANREADARGWDPVAVDGMLQEVEESTATLLPAAEQVLQELEEEARANWEERAIYHATQVTNLAGEAFETLSENRWSRRDCTEYQDELDWVMRTFRRVCDELDLTSMPAKMRRMARARQERVNHEYQRATRVLERLLQAHGERQEERSPPAGSGRRDERKYRDEFNIEHVPEQRMEYEDSVPMVRRSTLPVADVLSAERQERSWESAQGAGWSRPAMTDRSRGIGDLGMAGLNIGTPAHLQRGGRALQPAGASTLLGGSSGELPRTYSGSSARVDYRRRLELNTQDSDEDVLFRQEMRYPERGAGGFSGLRRAGAGESRASPPVQQLDVSAYLTASESASERGRSRHRGHPEDRPSAGCEEIGEDANQEEPEPASCRRRSRPAGQRGSPLWGQLALGGHGGRQATHATET